VAWVVGQSFFALEGRLRAALDRFVFVTDPKSDLSQAEWIRARLHEIGRTARVRYRWSRLANGLVGAWPAVFLAAAIELGESATAGTSAAMDVALPVTLVYIFGTFSFAFLCDRRSRRSVGDIEEFEAPGVLRSRLIGADKRARRLIAEAEQQSAGEQRQLLDILWRLAQAERARTDYLTSAEEFDADEFAPYLQEVEDARAGLGSWSSPVR
jgi:hypothetical protein